MRFRTLIVAVLAIVALRTQAECLQYNSKDTTLIGRVVLKSFGGPPNYGEEIANDSQEIQAILQLKSPICTVNSPSTFEEAELDQGEVTLVLPEDVALSQYENKKVSVTGALFLAATGHHHTPVLMSVSQHPRMVP